MVSETARKTSGPDTSKSGARTGVLAIIPALNEEEFIEICIRSLLTQETGLTNLLLVVADGGSTDKTCDIVQKMMQEFPQLRLMNNPNRLQSAGMNLAVETYGTASTRYIVRCDAHSVYPEYFIHDVVDSLDSTGAASVVVPMDARGDTCFEKANAWIVDTPLGSGGAPHRGGTESKYVEHGHHAGYDIDVYRRIGGYDANFSHNEDAEYDARVAKAGGQIYLNGDIRIIYIPRGNVFSLARQYFNYGKGRARTVTKHSMTLRLRQTIPMLVLLACIIGIVGGFFFSPLFLLPLGYAAILALASLWMTVKHRSGCGLFAGLAAGIMHMSWACGYIVQSARHLLVPENKYLVQIPLRTASEKPSDPASATLDIPTAANDDDINVLAGKASAPENTCIYAIGDIHGRLDLLQKLLEKIDADAAELDDGIKPVIVFLGDYIDRGFASKGVVDLILSDRLDAYECVYLAGNHEETLVNFMTDATKGQEWALYGGVETMFSYGVAVPQSAGMGAPVDWMPIWQAFRDAVPVEHLEFYRGLRDSVVLGDYVFVHAGLRPSVKLEQQSRRDMLWIRDEFLHSPVRFEKLVVHGHTPADDVHADNRRIGVDTGAYISGRLTAVRLISDEVSFLQT